MENHYYKSSGKISWLFILFLFLIIIVALPILSVIYIYLNFYMPIIYLNIVLVL